MYCNKLNTTWSNEGNRPCTSPQPGLKERYYSAYLMQLWLVLLCVVTLLGRKRGHWLTKPAGNEDAAWQQERSPEIPQNLHLPVCRGKRKGIVDSSLHLAAGVDMVAGCLDLGWRLGDVRAWETPNYFKIWVIKMTLVNYIPFITETQQNLICFNYV